MSGIYDQDAEDTADAMIRHLDSYDWQREDARQAVRDAHRPSWVARGFLALAALGTAALTFVAGYAVGDNDAVCHSATEDSVITDCDYRDGGWYED